MARLRQLRHLPPGEHQATVFWQEGSGLSAHERCAEFAGIKVTPAWTYIYPSADSNEVIRLSTKRNTSAQVYIGMSLREAMLERVANWISNSTSCCWGKPSSRRDCPTHTAEWVDEEVDRRVTAQRQAEEQWPAELARRQAEYTASLPERIAAIDAGLGEWRRTGNGWAIAIAGHQSGDQVKVRRRDGTQSTHVLGDQVGEDIYADGGEVVAAAA